MCDAFAAFILFLAHRKGLMQPQRPKGRENKDSHRHIFTPRMSRLDCGRMEKKEENKSGRLHNEVEQ